jgi:hypothetical protein
VPKSTITGPVDTCSGPRLLAVGIGEGSVVALGPITLFDKSFLQSLSLDESVWFAHFFMPVVCPLFYVETLADLEKAVKAGRTPEQEVGIIASKFPDASGNPCTHHRTLVIGELVGYPVPMDGRIPLSGGRDVVLEGKHGTLFDESPEARAFTRWQRGEFLEIERDVAKQWRAALGAVDLEAVAKNLRDMGISASTCRSLNDARTMAESVVLRSDKPFPTVALLVQLLNIPRQYHERIIERWKINGFRPLLEHAPYSAHVLSVELFFQFALAAHLIGTQRASNRVDIAYLDYLPFCTLFASSDDLHRRCAPLFMRPNQEFVWGPDFKGDLARINAHFLTLPESERNRGITFFAQAPPKIEGSLVRRLRASYMGAGYDDQPPIEPPVKGDPRHTKLIEDLDKWQKAPDAPADARQPADGERVELLSLKRRVHKKRGSWYQVPKDLKNEP